MQTRVARFDRRFWAALVLGGVASAAVLALSADRARPETTRGALLISELRSPSGGAERGIVHITAQPDSASITGVLVGIAVDPSDPSGNTVYLAASRRGCSDGEVEDHQVIGKVAKATVDANGSAVWDDTDIVHVVRWRDAKSVIGIGTIWEAGKRRPVKGVGLCGRISRIRLLDIN